MTKEVLCNTVTVAVRGTGMSGGEGGREERLNFVDYFSPHLPYNLQRSIKHS